MRPVKETIEVRAGARQLFLDDYVVDELRGLRRVLHQPQKHHANPVLEADRPWERDLAMGSGVYEPELGKVRLWYRAAFRPPELQGVLALDPQQRLDLLKKILKTVVCRVALAESDDGVRFHKPNFGLINLDGSNTNNLVWGRMGDWACMVQKFSEERDAAKRYKMIIWAHPEFGGYSGSIGLTSPDGLHWTMAPRPVEGKLRHAYNFCHTVERNEYLALIQMQTKPRTIGRMVSPDFVNWGKATEVLVPDGSDPPATEFYVATVTKLDDLYLCYLHVLHADPREDGAVTARQHGTIDVQLATSRDGVNWERAARRGVFFPLGEASAFDAGMIFVSPPLPFQGKLWFYYTGVNVEHGSYEPHRQSAIGLATLRVDGYVSLEPSGASGELITKAFRLNGGKLKLNADAANGNIRLAVLDADRKPLPGFGEEQASAITTDDLAIPVEWKGSASLGQLTGQTIRLRFRISCSRLYGFCVS